MCARFRNFCLEEGITSAALGLKGYIDATILARFQDDRGVARLAVAPLELKTGRVSDFAQNAARAQAQLYLPLLVRLGAAGSRAPAPAPHASEAQVPAALEKKLV